MFIFECTQLKKIVLFKSSYTKFEKIHELNLIIIKYELLVTLILEYLLCIKYKRHSQQPIYHI